MQIALDYDKTYTLDPMFWNKFVDLAKSCGHTISIVTMRHPHEAITDVELPIVYTSRKAKNKHFLADIWIDDSPNWIFQDSM
jgi:hypothetical protein